MFKNYHIVIFKDREGGFRNLRLRGWLGAILFLLVVALAGTNIYLLGFYSRSLALEHEREGCSGFGLDLAQPGRQASGP